MHDAHDDALDDAQDDAQEERLPEGPPERYGLRWPGRGAAERAARTPPHGRLVPVPGASLGPDATGNLLVEGDNLSVLKLLEADYAGRVRLVTIDPPYNTGRAFLYRDDYRAGVQDYLRQSGQVDADGRPRVEAVETHGRTHAGWLSMMYPRLAVARRLMAEDGVIFVCIDDNEVHNLRHLMDAVFGPDNFVTTVIWQKVYAPKSSARHFSEDHDYIVVYAKDAARWRPGLLPRTARQDARYKNPDGDPRGPWRPNNLAARNPYSKGTYAITCPGGRVIAGPPAGSYWRLSEERLRELDADGRIWWGKDGNNVPAPKIYLSEVKPGRVPQTLWTHPEVGHTQAAKRELLRRVSFASSAGVFETPKPLALVERMLRIGTRPDRGDVVLDFFAGSGTTGEATWRLNAEDGGDRRFVLVQLPEPTGQPDHPTIAHITRARLRAAAAALRQEGADPALDLGLRVLRHEGA